MTGETTYANRRRWLLRLWHAWQDRRKPTIDAGRRAHRMVVGLGIHNASQRKFLRRG